MSDKEVLEGEVVKRGSHRGSAHRTNIRVLKLTRIKAVLILIFVIALLALILKFLVGFLAIILQSIVILVAVWLISSLIYNLVKGGK